MKPLHILIAAGLLYVAAWLVPVHDGLSHLPDALPGWEALRLALAPVWPLEDLSFEDEGVAAVLFFTSALTNVLMVVLALAFSPGSCPTAVWLGWAFVAAALINSHWLLMPVEDTSRVDLQIGYYLWWFSFGAAAAGLFLEARQAPAPVSAPEPAS